MAKSYKSSFFLIVPIFLFSCGGAPGVHFSAAYKKPTFTKPTVGVVFIEDRFNLYGAGRPDSIFGAGEVNTKALNFFKTEFVTALENLSGLEVHTGSLTGTYPVEKTYVTKPDGSFQVLYPAINSPLPVTENLSDVDVLCIVSDIYMGNEINSTQYSSFNMNGTPGVNTAITSTKILTGSNIVIWDNKKNQMVSYSRPEGLSPVSSLKSVTLEKWKTAISAHCKKAFSAIPIMKQ